MLIEVTCAIIEQAGKVLAVQKGNSGVMANKWEFAGGKVESNETQRKCLLREIKEELNIEIDIWEELPFSDVQSEVQTIRLIPFICSVRNGNEIELLEHKAMIWLAPQELYTLNWAIADLKVIENYLKFINSRKH